MREKVKIATQDLGLDVSVMTLTTSTRTVQEAAEAVGCDPARIAKSIVFVADGDPVLCVASGAARVDPDLLCGVLDCAEVRQAQPDEVRAATGFPVGGVPPLAHELPVVLDESLLIHARVWAAAGDGNSLFEVDPRALAERTGARVARIQR